MNYVNVYCSNCREKFADVGTHEEDGRTYCNNCNYEIGVTYEVDFNQLSVATHRELRPPKRDDDSYKEKEHNWILYDAFSHILACMTKKLTGCCADDELRLAVLRLWIPFLNNSPSELLFNRTVVKRATRKKRTKVHPPLDQEMMNDDNVSELLKRNGRRRSRKQFLNKTREDFAGGGGDVVDVENAPQAVQKPKMPMSRRAQIAPIANLLPSSVAEQMLTSRMFLRDPEYVTLPKLISFLHGALLLNNSQVTLADVVHWIREGFLPFFNAHLLLPPDMKCSGNDSRVLGCVSQRKLPSIGGICENTGKVLTRLKIKQFNIPPIHLLAEKIINDLQLPSELVGCVRNLEMIVYNSGEWGTMRVSGQVANIDSYAAAFVLVMLKQILGLDGKSEYLNSHFARQVNSILRLKPSFGRDHQSGGGGHRCQTFKTLFEWDKWQLFIKRRQNVLQKHHPPTAIRAAKANDLSPDMLREMISKRPRHDKDAKQSRLYELIGGELADIYGVQQRESDASAQQPDFKPCMLPTQGLVEQLIEFEPHRFKPLLEQRFPESTFAFIGDEEKLGQLENALWHVDPSLVLVVHNGSAHGRFEMHIPYYGSWKITENKEAFVGRKDVELTKNVVYHRSNKVAVPDSVGERLLHLYVPSEELWANSALYLNRSSYSDWEVFSQRLPSSFRWLLDHVSEVVEDHPKNVYHNVCSIEAAIFRNMRQTSVVHSMTDGKNLKMRLDSATKNKLHVAYANRQFV